MLTVEEALALVLAGAPTLAPTVIPLDRAAGHVLARDAVASLNLPSFPNSAVDGFAVRAAELRGAAASTPVLLPLLGETQAGDPPGVFPDGRGCIRIMTGAAVPDGADAIVMKEDTAPGPSGAIAFHTTHTAGENVRPAGQDIRSGDCAVPAGTFLRPSEIAMLASLGLQQVDVFPRPRVALFTTGNELVLPGQARQPGQIFNSNRYMLQAQARASGFPVPHLQHIIDSLQDTIASIRDAAGSHEAIVSSGGVSVGEYDYVRTALETLGKVVFWQVSMKPGKPLVYGQIGRCLFFGLPGNPVSSMVSFELFVRPALLKMAGHQKLHRPRVRARLLAPLPHRPGREEFARVLTTRIGDEFVAHPHPGQASHMVSSMVGANSLAIVPAEAGSLPEGARVDVLMTDWPEE